MFFTVVQLLVFATNPEGRRFIIAHVLTAEIPHSFVQAISIAPS